MTTGELLALLARLRRRRTELDDVEVKSSRRGTPEDIWKTICAFANRKGGGVILFGVDNRFEVVGVGDPDRLQAEVTAQANELEPPVRLTLSLHTVDDRLVLAAEVPEVEPEFRPCHKRSLGVYSGSWVRTGDGDRRMSEYEVFLALRSRAQPVEDQQPVLGATMSDLDEEMVGRYLDRIRTTRPHLSQIYARREELLQVLGIASRDDPKVPTLAGLLVFGRYPQAFFPNLVIAVGRFDDAPGARFTGSQLCEGPMLAMLEQAMRTIAGLMRTSTLVTGLVHQEVPEYPWEAVREALVNAVAHRDYSRYAVGTQVQVNLFRDRMEITNPGGLYGPFTVDDLGRPGFQSTRNATLARLLADLGPMENRGTGLAAMARALRQAHLPPPEFTDGVVYFQVRFRNESLLDPETVAWLNHFSHLPLSRFQRLALAFIRKHGRITPNQYRFLTDTTDPRLATRDLMGLVEQGLLERTGTGRGTVYLPGDGFPRPDQPSVRSEVSLSDLEARLLRILAEEGPLGSRDLAGRLGLSRSGVLQTVSRLVERGLLEADGSPRSPRRRYRVRRPPSEEGPGV